MNYEHYKIWLTVKNKVLDLTWFLVAILAVTLPISFVMKVVFIPHSRDFMLTEAFLISIAINILFLFEIFVLLDYHFVSMDTINYYGRKKELDSMDLIVSVIKSSMTIYIFVLIITFVILGFYYIIGVSLFKPDQLIIQIYKSPITFIGIIIFFIVIPLLIYAIFRFSRFIKIYENKSG